MKKIKKALLLALSLALSVTMFAACGFQSESSGTGSGNQTTDTGSSDTGSTDTGSSDTGSTDTGSTDAPCEHTGGTATCTAKAECELCGEEYGEFAAHDYTVVKYDDDSHWYECACGVKDEESDVAHSGGTATCMAKAVCAVCEQAYGELAAHNYEEKYAYVGLMMVMGGGEWAIATEGGQAFGTLSSNYGYMPAVEVALGQRSFVSSVNVTYTFTQVGIASYTIQDTNGKYIYMKGTYDNFNVSATLPEEGGTWTIDTSEGLAKITNDLTGKWIQYSENFGTFGAYNTQKGVNVNVYGYNPDESYNPNRSDATNHWLECVCGEKKDVTAHDYSVTKKDATNHWNICSVCGVVDENSVVAHNFNIPKTSDTQHWNECECGRYDNKVDHTLESKYDATQHWQVCDCGYETEKTAHTLTYAYENHQHWQVCDCGYETEKVDCLYMSEDEETAMSCVKYDAEKHWIQCICGQELVMVDEGLTGPHWWDDDYDSMCDFCGYTREIKITLEDAVIVEQVAGKFTLPDEVLGNVQSVNIGEFAFTGINGKDVTIGANELVAQAEVGEGKTMIVVTDKATYTIPANVYTMIIDDKAELDQWQAVAAENAVKAGLVIEAQMGMTYTGYFLLNANIEYNGVWAPYKAYGALWGLCYNNAAIWEDGKIPTYENGVITNDASGVLVDGAFQEDWGTGKLGGFKAVFDGNGHYINGMETSGDFAGFVVTMGGGTIKDVAFTNASIGANAGFVSNRGPGTIENVYVQVVSMGNGQNSDNPSSVITRHGNPGNVLNNILVDMSSINVATLKYACIANLASDPTNGVYIIGGEGLGEPAKDFSESAAAKTFLHYNADSGNAGDYDVAGSFATAADLLADETHGAVVAAWAGDFWTVDAENGTVLPTALTTATPVRAAKIEASTGTLSVYSGDVTALGYAAGTTVYDYSAPGAAAWDNRVKIYTAGENVKTNVLRYDMVLSAIPTGAIVFWMDKGGATYVRTVNVNQFGVADWGGCYEEAKETTYGLTEADQKSQISIYEKETNVLVSMNGWKTNTVYTVEIYHNGASNVTMGLSNSMHAYIANVEYISLDDSNPITASANSMILPSYTGDVTKLGFAAGTTVYAYGTPTTSTDQWGNTGATYGATQWWAMAISSIGVKQNADGTESIAIQFMLPKLPANNPLFVVWMKTNNNGQLLPQINQNSIQQTQAKYTVVTTDAEGNTPASVEAGKVYTMTITLTDTADDITGGHWSFVDYANNSVMYVAK